jgi:hypothetical protein
MLSFLSEIERIKNAKPEIRNTIINKGVYVDTTQTID